MKKLMLLGGSRYLRPVIKEARELGLYIITCDYLPDNYAHKYADKYLNISIVDKDAVLEAARAEGIDGIMSFACDPGVVTGAYVAEKLGLPYGGSYESVSILQDKGRFRAFLTEHGFNVPKSASFPAEEHLENVMAAIADFRRPVIVKPVDSAGSKGVRRVDSDDGIPSAIENALASSICGRFIIEEFIVQEGFASDTECFTNNGELVFASFNNQRFDAQADNPYTPAGFTWPSTMPERFQKELRSELQRLLRLLDMKSTVYNIESRLGTDGRAYLMEVSPRGGGNRLCEMVQYASGTNLIRNAVKAAVGLEIEELHDPVYDGAWAYVVVHSDMAGTFKGLQIAPEVENKIVERDMWVQPGDRVEAFTGANKTIGTLVVRFDSQEEAAERMADIRGWVKVITEE